MMLTINILSGGSITMKEKICGFGKKLWGAIKYAFKEGVHAFVGAFCRAMLGEVSYA